MRCPACDHDNRTQAKFCEACGAPLPPAGGATASRPSGAQPPPLSYTPRHLAERILTTRTALQGERKPVTVLFADITGSMALAEQLDPEDWHAIMNRFFAILADGVHRFEGTINQYTGDGIMALFGAPIAHEDHAQRACHAALALVPALRAYAQQLRRERGLQFSVRMGLNSGDVVVGSIGDDLRMDYTAQGHTVGLAARMEQLCEPGRVYLSEETAALVEGFFELEDLGQFTIKGVRAPVRVCALIGPGRARTRFDISRARGLSRFVGRADETAQLEAAMAEAAGGRCIVVAVSADAGVGKSRLCVELADSARARGGSVAATQGLAHGVSVPYLPILTLLRQLVGVEERDAPDAVRQKVAGALLLIDDAFKDRLPALFDFLGVPGGERVRGATDAEARLQVVLDACVGVLRAKAARQPALVLVEDLHWIDPASDAFLRRLVAALREVGVLLVLNFRPEYRAEWLPRDAARWIALRPLTAADSRRLIDELLGGDPSLGDLAARLCERAGGNPFFAEELVRALAQSGALTGVKGAYGLLRPIDAQAIPASVHAVLAARIDRLGERDKDVLQTAAVIGKHFVEPVLRSVTTLPGADLAASLHVLTGAELIFAGAAYPVAEYAFTHPLTQEVAYATQLATRRAHLHAQVARVLESLPDAVTAERAALIAYHWEHAGARWEAAQWHRQAASALIGTDTREGLSRLHRALELLETLPETAETVEAILVTSDDLLRVGTLSAMARGEAEALFTRARALAERSGNRTLLVHLLSTYGELCMTLGDSVRASEHLRAATALAGEVDDAQLYIDVALDNAQSAFWAGRLRAALAHLDEIRSHGRRGIRPRQMTLNVGLNGDAFMLALRGMCLAQVGRVREGTADLERALRLADTNEALEGRCIARQFCAFGAHVTGAPRAGLPYAEAALELAVRSGNPYLQRMGLANLGAAKVLGDQLDEGVQTLEQLVGSPELSNDVIAWYLMPTLAEGYRRRGDAARALEISARSVELARAAGLLTAECIAQLTHASTLAAGRGAAGRPEIEAALARVDALIQESGAEVWRPRWHQSRAHLRAALGDAAGRARELQTAVRLCREMEMEELADQMVHELSGGGEIGSVQ
jgi:class 3 adenylate cyclase